MQQFGYISDEIETWNQGQYPKGVIYIIQTTIYMHQNQISNLCP